MASLHETRGRLLRELAIAAKRESPLYARLWRDFAPELLDLPTDLGRIPFTTREHLSSCDPFDLVWSSRPSVQAYYESSGTTGAFTPGFPDLSFEKCAEFGRFLDGWMRLTQHRVRRAVVALAFEMNPTGIRFQMALPTLGITVLPLGTRSTICPPERQVDVIRRLKPQAIFGRPLEILRLADAWLELGGDPGQLEVTKLFYTGEIVSAAKWARLQRAWDGAEVFGHYGLTELDSGLQTCEHGRYHEPQTPYLLTELVSERTLLPVSPGERGELVFTTLRRSSTPLFRYRTGDLALSDTAPCPCGARTPSYRILGRKSDEMHEHERSAFPIDFEQIVLEHADTGNEYQILRDARGRLVLVVESRFGFRGDVAIIERELVTGIATRLGFDVAVQVRPFGGIADKLGIAKQKAGGCLFLTTDELEPDTALPINCLDRAELRSQRGEPLSI